MKSNYELLGKHIRQIDVRNTENVTDNVLGINIDKYFMPSVANVVGTDLSRYKLITKGKFACNPMHVGRDECLPVALYDDGDPALVSPAYFMFEVIDESVLDSEYLMMWFRRPEFDRCCWLRTDGSVRGGITWDDICRLELPIPDHDEQLRIVAKYKAITERIALKQRINDNLEATLSAIFLDRFSLSDGGLTMPLGDLITFENGKARPKSEGAIPVYGGNGVLSYTSPYNAENVVLIGRVGAYCGSVHIEEGQCWVSDNAISAKSKISAHEYFDYFLLKSLNLYDHHVGTGQQLLTQGILNKIEVSKVGREDVEVFNALCNRAFLTIMNNRKEITRLEALQSIFLANISA